MGTITFHYSPALRARASALHRRFGSWQAVREVIKRDPSLGRIVDPFEIIPTGPQA